MSDKGNVIPWFTGCETGKRGYYNKKDAKKSLSRIGHGAVEGHIGPYKCEKCGFWHNGHLPKSIVNGTDARDDIRSGTLTLHRGE